MATAARRKSALKYYYAHREKCRAAVLQYDRTHREARKAYIAKYNRDHGVHLNKCRQQRRRAQPEKETRLNAEWYANNRGKKRDYYMRNIDRARVRQWQRQGIDMSQWSYTHFLAMLAEQEGRCAGCNAGIVATKNEVVGEFKLAHVDHDHSTGHVRGLLCRSCNFILGMAGDDPNVLLTLANYLRVCGDHT